MMTYKDALEIIKEHMVRHEEEDFYSISPAFLLSMFQKLGMLKLDAPKSANERAVDSMFSFSVGTGEMLTPRHALRAIDAAGLKIVEK